MRPEALWLAERLSDRNAGLGARARAAAKTADPQTLAQLELQLSAAYADQVTGRLRSGPSQPFAFVDPELGPPKGRVKKALQAAASARDLQAHLEASLAARNPIQAELEHTLEDYRATWVRLPAVTVPASAGPRPSPATVAALAPRLGLTRRATYDAEVAERVTAFQKAHGLPPTGVADPETIRTLNRGPGAYERLIEANLERARALPSDLGDRFILVDAAAGELTYYDHGEARTTMKVVTGKPSQPTPMMVGLVRYLMFNPYWNVPEDLVRTSIAPKVLARGQSYVTDDGLLVLSDYSEKAVPLDPAGVDWQAVARGDVTVRVRQRPGPKNMMGKVKLMLPNPLGIYLHDTPMRDDFARSQRLASSGCIRLEDALRLARLLVGEKRFERATNDPGRERRVDLKKPVPVYITYFTAMPTPQGLVVRPDVYGRDSQRVAQGVAAPTTHRAPVSDEQEVRREAEAGRQDPDPAARGLAATRRQGGERPEDAQWL